MKPQIAAGVLLIVIIAGYLLGFMGGIPPFIVFFPFVLLALLFAIFLFATTLIWKFTPGGIKEIHKTHKGGPGKIILACFIFLFFGGWAINHYCLPGLINPVILLVNLLILIFMIFLQWCLITLQKKKILFTGLALFALCILSIALFMVFKPGSGEHADSSSVEALKTLPYVAWVPAEKAVDKSGVTKHSQNCFEGINVFCLEALSTAYLMDTSGEILHTWYVGENVAWNHVKFCENGDLLGGIYDGVFTRSSWDSNLIWAREMRFHHDIAITESKDIYVLDRKGEVVFSFGLPILILNDYIVILSPEGKVKREINLFKVLRKKIPFSRILDIYGEIIEVHRTTDYKILWGLLRQGRKSEVASDSPFDVLHNNTATIIDRNIDGLCRKGDVLISARDIDLIGIMDIETEELIWSWGPGNLEGQHKPVLLENGNIMIYDNGRQRGYSRVIELDPFTKKIVWEYKANPPEQFYSLHGGEAQRLPNGNTLITEEEKGRAFEVTKDGEIVWEFYSPKSQADDERPTIYRMERITDTEILKLIKKRL